MKTTVDHSHKHSVANILFFGISASIFTLSIFFSLYQSNEKINLYNEVSNIINSRMVKPTLAATITETYAVNLRELLTIDAETPIVVESWMTEPYTVKKPVSAIPSTVFEKSITVEDWMTDLNSWNTASMNVPVEEKALTIESWMLNLDEWAVPNTTGTYPADEFAAETLYIEEWMLSLDNWSTVFNEATYEEAPIRIESWMLDTSDWLSAK